MTTKEMRKHIKPFLRYAIKTLQKKISSMGESEEAAITEVGLCMILCDYTKQLENGSHIDDYIQSRLDDDKVRPDDAGYGEWYPTTKEGIQKRIDFCKLQLKIVKP